MNFIYEKQDDVAILTLKGKLIGSPETDKLHDKVLSLIEDGITKMVIDLKFITWMGSLGIGALMRCLMTIRRADGDLRLSGLSEKVKKLFSITKLSFSIKTVKPKLFAKGTAVIRKKFASIFRLKSDS